MIIDPAGDHPIGEVSLSSASVPGHPHRDLTSADVAARLDKVGPNEVREAHEPAWLEFARRVRGPLP